MEQMGGEGTRIRDISCTLIPGEEVVFSVYEGPTALAVRQHNERAAIPVSRIVEAIAVSRRLAGSEDNRAQVRHSGGSAACGLPCKKRQS